MSISIFLQNETGATHIQVVKFEKIRFHPEVMSSEVWLEFTCNLNIHSTLCMHWDPK